MHSIARIIYNRRIIFEETLMICKWCNGTGEECGCGLGYCAHCNNGVTTNPPYGPITLDYCEELNILTDKDFEEMNLGRVSAISCIELVSIQLVGKQILSEEELQTFRDYWCDDARDETLGRFLNRVAWLVKQKMKKEDMVNE